METIERYDGPFDVVLIDHLKGRYADAYRAVLPKVRTGGVIVADNITRGPIDFGDLVAPTARRFQIPNRHPRNR